MTQNITTRVERMCPFWNIPFLEYAVLESALIGMWIKWNVLFWDCLLIWICHFWNPSCTKDFSIERVSFSPGFCSCSRTTARPREKDALYWKEGFQKGQIQMSTHSQKSTFHFIHMPKRADSTFHKGHILSTLVVIFWVTKPWYVTPLFQFFGSYI